MDNDKIAAIFEKSPNDSGLSFLKSTSIYPFLFIVFPFFNGFINPILIQNKLLFWIIDAIDHAIIPIILLFIFRNKNNWVQSSFKWPKGIEEWANFAFLLLGVLIIGPFIFEYINDACQLAFKSNFLFNGVPFKTAFDGVNFSKITLVLYAALSAGIFEEVFIKGIFYKIFIDNKHSVYKTYIILSLLFAIIHWNQGVVGILTAFTYSILSFLLYGHIKNLIPLILLHFAIDLDVFYFSICR